jgi:hypothetical protein
MIESSIAPLLKVIAVLNTFGSLEYLVYLFKADVPVLLSVCCLRCLFVLLSISLSLSLSHSPSHILTYPIPLTVPIFLCKLFISTLPNFPPHLLCCLHASFLPKMLLFCLLDWSHEKDYFNFNLNLQLE